MSEDRSGKVDKPQGTLLPNPWKDATSAEVEQAFKDYVDRSVSGEDECWKSPEDRFLAFRCGHLVYRRHVIPSPVARYFEIAGLMNIELGVHEELPGAWDSVSFEKGSSSLNREGQQRLHSRAATIGLHVLEQQLEIYVTYANNQLTFLQFGEDNPEAPQGQEDQATLFFENWSNDNQRQLTKSPSGKYEVKKAESFYICERTNDRGQVARYKLPIQIDQGYILNTLLSPDLRDNPYTAPPQADSWFNVDFLQAIGGERK